QGRDEGREGQGGGFFAVAVVALIQRVGAGGEVVEQHARVLGEVAGPPVDVGHQRALVPADQRRGGPAAGGGRGVVGVVQILEDRPQRTVQAGRELRTAGGLALVVLFQGVAQLADVLVQVVGGDEGLLVTQRLHGPVAVLQFGQ